MVKFSTTLVVNNEYSTYDTYMNTLSKCLHIKLNLTKNKSIVIILTHRDERKWRYLRATYLP